MLRSIVPIFATSWVALLLPPLGVSDAVDRVVGLWLASDCAMRMRVTCSVKRLRTPTMAKAFWRCSAVK
jgi:hypothetical protein